MVCYNQITTISLSLWRVKYMIAIYARKSVERENSISIEAQIEMCKYEARGEQCVIYSDNGYSGKNTNRPDFQRMIEDIKANKIHKVIVYRLDRISRSILDFAEMMDLFQKYKVDFVSATEHFDTSSPMGRAMLNICIVFAQMERETIQQRVTDAYESRSQKGFYMGGRVPYGYKLIPTTINGIQTKMYEAEPEEAEDIKLIYQLYSKPSATLGDVFRELVKRGININRRGNTWSTPRLSEVMRNPAYTYADSKTYEFFKEQKSNIIDSPDCYTGETGLYLYKGENTNRKTWDLSNQNIVVAPHKPLVDSDTWITCRKKLLSNHQVKTCKAKNSFLAGLIKCGHCGYSMAVRKSSRAKSEPVKYFIDMGKSVNHVCNEKVPTLRVSKFELEIVERIREKINSLTIQKIQTNFKDNRINELILQKDTIQAEIDNLVNTLTTTQNQTTILYIDRKINQLDSQLHDIDFEIETVRKEQQNKQDIHEQLSDVMSKWNYLTFDDKRSVAMLLINKILVFTDHIEIIWNV